MVGLGGRENAKDSWRQCIESRSYHKGMEKSIQFNVSTAYSIRDSVNKWKWKISCFSRKSSYALNIPFAVQNEKHKIECNERVTRRKTIKTMFLIMHNSMSQTLQTTLDKPLGFWIMAFKLQDWSWWAVLLLSKWLESIMSKMMKWPLSFFDVALPKRNRKWKLYITH